MKEVVWPMTTRIFETLAFPLTPESYFLLQNHEQSWVTPLAAWFEREGLLPTNCRVHGLVLMAPRFSQLAGYLFLEMHEPGFPHHILNFIPVDVSTEVLAVSESLQAWILEQGR